MSYINFIESKKVININKGFESNNLNSNLFDFQKMIVKWACLKGKAAIFADTGLGKTLMQIEWANQVSKKTGGNILIIAPLAVVFQTIEEGKRFGYDLFTYDKNSNINENEGLIYITNYDKLENLDTEKFIGVVLDESSILKNFAGSMRNLIIDKFVNTTFKLACSATPSPNDFMELGNHSEFLNIMSFNEMLATFFIHDGGSTQSWRIKGHAHIKFWEWVASWAFLIKSPSDFGFNSDKYELPELIIKRITVDTNYDNIDSFIANTLDERRAARKNSLTNRVIKTSELANNNDSQFLIWCDYNEEAEKLEKLINNSVNVHGSMDAEKKASHMINFTKNKIKVLITKPRIAGFGMNWQNCNNIAFCGLNDSFEQFYQCIRRCWRFGQKKHVTVYIIISDPELTVYNNIQNKQNKNDEMVKQMIKQTKDINIRDSEQQNVISESIYEEKEIKNKNYEIYNADCVEITKKLESESIDYTIFSPPFASLYTYSNSDRDMGNSKSYLEFMRHFKFLVKELYRVTKKGRLLSFHCMNFPTTLQRDGYIGIKDFRGHLIKMFERAGFIFHSEVCIWKNPVVQMQRTKALGLLHKQIKKDSTRSRQGMADYLITMGKSGLNKKPCSNTAESFPIDLWQRLASPVWFDINPSETLQFRTAKDNNDEKHICPLQLQVIRRALKLWTTDQDTVLSPFMGIGSEGYEALKTNKKFIGIELKKSYFNLAHKNLESAIFEYNNSQNTLFNF